MRTPVPASSPGELSPKYYCCCPSLATLPCWVGEGRTTKGSGRFEPLLPQPPITGNKSPGSPAGGRVPALIAGDGTKAPRLPWRLPESQPLFPLRLWEAETYLGSSCAPAGPLPRGGRRRGGAGNVANPRAIESAPCWRSSPAPGQARETELKCSMMAAAGM